MARWQLYDKTRAYLSAAVDPNGAAVFLDDFLDNGQAQACALGFSCNIRLKNLLYLIFPDAGPVVVKRYLNEIRIIFLDSGADGFQYALSHSRVQSILIH